MCKSSETPEEARIRLGSTQIDREIQNDKIEREKAGASTVKILLLGAMECGKSTVLKQMKLLYNNGFTLEEKEHFKTAITKNIVTCAQTLVTAMDLLKIPYGFDPHTASDVIGFSDRISDSERSVESSVYSNSRPSIRTIESGCIAEGVLHKADDIVSRAAKGLYDGTKPRPEYARIVKAADSNSSLSEPLIKAIKSLWSDTGIQYCYSRSNEYQLLDCCNYVLGGLERFSKKEFVPSEADILNARVATTNITEMKFELNELKTCIVFDVGGQRSERKKWAPYFQDVSSIIFLIAISDYCNTCFEDSNSNRMVESLQLFGSICNHPMFKNTAMIAFFNKIDLFKEKIPKIPISTCFPLFTGPNTFEAGCKYFEKRVHNINKYPERKIYTFFTWATDSSQMKKILTAVIDIIIKRGLSDFGI